MKSIACKVYFDVDFLKMRSKKSIAFLRTLSMIETQLQVVLGKKNSIGSYNQVSPGVQLASGMA